MAEVLGRGPPTAVPSTRFDLSVRLERRTLFKELSKRLGSWPWLSYEQRHLKIIAIQYSKESSSHVSMF